jgi:hypothetical protein
MRGNGCVVAGANRGYIDTWMSTGRFPHLPNY